MNPDLIAAIALLAPVAAAVLALAFQDGRGSRSVPASCLLAAAGAAGALVWLESHGTDASWRGFAPNPWSASLAAAALVAAAGAAHRLRVHAARAAASIAAALSVATLFSPDLLWVAVCVAASSVAFLVARSFEGRGSRLDALLVGVSDVLIVGAAVLAARTSVGFDALAGAPAVLLVAGGAIRMLADAELYGAARAQGAAVCAAAVVASSSARSTALVAGAVIAAGGIVMAMRPERGRWSSMLTAATFAVGIGAGGTSAAWGGAIAIVSGILLSALRTRYAFAIAPFLGQFVGLFLVAGAVSRVAAVEAEWMIVAALLVTFAIAGATAAWRSWDADPGEPRWIGGSVAAFALAPTIALALAPEQAFGEVVGGVGIQLGVTPPLSSVLAPPAAVLGVVAGIAGALGFVAGAMASPPAAPADARPEAASHPAVPSALWAAPALAAALAVVAFFLAGSRGWL